MIHFDDNDYCDEESDVNAFLRNWVNWLLGTCLIVLAIWCTLITFARWNRDSCFVWELTMLPVFRWQLLLGTFALLLRTTVCLVYHDMSSKVANVLVYGMRWTRWYFDLWTIFVLVENDVGIRAMRRTAMKTVIMDCIIVILGALETENESNVSSYVEFNGKPLAILSITNLVVVFLFCVTMLLIKYIHLKPTREGNVWLDIYLITFAGMEMFIVVLYLVRKVNCVIVVIHEFFIWIFLPPLLVLALHKYSSFWKKFAHVLARSGKGTIERRWSKLSIFNLKDNDAYERLLDFTKSECNLIDFTQISLADPKDFFAAGAFAKVLKGVYGNVPIAAKRLNMEIRVESICSFVKESFLSSKLEHKNIVKFYGCCPRPPSFYLIYEFCNGGTLLASFYGPRRFSMTLDTKVTLLLDIVNGLDYLHSLNILHRDVKPDNILLHADGERGLLQAKICDFGTAKKVGPTDQNKTLEGTIDYLPPEILDKILIDFHNLMLDPKKRHLLEYRKSGDVYAFGVTTWEFLSEKKILENLDLESMKREILSGRRQPLPNRLPPWCQSMLDDCWAHKPEERLSFNDLKVQLQSKVEVYGHFIDSRTSYSSTIHKMKSVDPNLLHQISKNQKTNSSKRPKQRSFLVTRLSRDYWKRRSSSWSRSTSAKPEDRDRGLYNEDNNLNVSPNLLNSTNLVEHELDIVSKHDDLSFNSGLEPIEIRRSHLNKSTERKLPLTE